MNRKEPGVPGRQGRAFQAREIIKTLEVEVSVACYSDKRKTRETRLRGKGKGIDLNERDEQAARRCRSYRPRERGGFYP